jgi:hypothetical protein
MDLNEVEGKEQYCAEVSGSQLWKISMMMWILIVLGKTD